MLQELIKNGYGDEQDFNCAETILYGANEAYHLGLDIEALKMSAGFGAGMFIGDKCGALTAAVMVLSHLFTDRVAHNTPKLTDLVKELFERYREKMGEVDCTPLKEKYRTKENGCHIVIYEAAVILDDIVSREKNKGI